MKPHLFKKSITILLKMKKTCFSINIIKFILVMFFMFLLIYSIYLIKRGVKTSNYSDFINVLIGGWIGSFIISAIFYVFPIKSDFKKIDNAISAKISTKIISSIAKKYSGVSTGDLENCKKHFMENQIEANIVSNIFIKTEKCVKYYKNKFDEMKTDNKKPLTWLRFANFDCSIDEYTEYNTLRKSFKEDIKFAIYDDIFKT